MPAYYLNLAITGNHTPWVAVGDATRVGIDVHAQSGQTWTNAVVELEYTLETNLPESDGPEASQEQARSMGVAVTLTASAPSRRNVPCTGAGYVRLNVSTGATGEDPLATAVIRLDA